jgi:hypothetical protein
LANIALPLLDEHLTVACGAIGSRAPPRTICEPALEYDEAVIGGLPISWAILDGRPIGGSLGVPETIAARAGTDN